MSESIQVVAIVTPTSGKHERVKTLLTGVAEKVHANEPDVLKYQVFEQVGSDGVNTFVVQETYKNKAAHEKHYQTEYFQALGKAIGDEKLLAGPLDVKTIKPIGGFASR